MITDTTVRNYSIIGPAEVNAGETKTYRLTPSLVEGTTAQWGLASREDSDNTKNNSTLGDATEVTFGAGEKGYVVVSCLINNGEQLCTYPIKVNNVTEVPEEEEPAED
jgi:hypothetical protein